MSIKILIADDHSLLRQGIKRVLNFEGDIEVVGEAGDGQEALAKTLVLQPDILLLDLNMPGLSGLEVTKQLIAARVKTRIIALTIHDSEKYVLETLKNGAAGYLLKDVEPTMTPREMDVLACIAKGFSNQDIAQALFLSEKTVKNHLTNIFRKLNVNDRTQALIYVLKNKIVSLE